ncbi:GNAT family N-acetyltransferase [Blastococcus sp. Marseille-P5729]|uniref:GNAT family N-acetyltransferase n=1 Tax=Blastococcus sp. Marseille-P5729 TaxID=2086582 RepID=UPI000D0F3DE4|nr:GNAT family N-acetyltransferase [Blastococcus sp. Marseille-P5729]
MEFTVSFNEQANRFEAVTDDGTLAGFTEYHVEGETVVMPHTVTEDGFEGQGVGSKVVKAALEAARGDGKKVDPKCPFVASYIERHQEYADLVA